MRMKRTFNTMGITKQGGNGHRPSGMEEDRTGKQGPLRTVALEDRRNLGEGVGGKEGQMLPNIFST
jgi:hypothetical protein